jgi:predicted nucleic acid-binding protein
VSAPGQRGPRGRPDLAYADTNLFVALLAGPGHPPHEQALGVFRRVADGGLGLIVTPIVVAELVYIARSLFGWTRPVTAQRLGALLEADGLVLTEGSVLVRALRLLGERSRLDFADAYLAALALEVGPPAVASFDADLDTVEGVRRISA